MSEWRHQPDGEIVRRAQRGDEAAFAVLVRAHEARVFNYVYRVLGDRALAEDLTQEVFLRVFQALPRFSFGCRFTTWLFQVTKNRVMDELRTRDRLPRHPMELEDLPSLVAVDAQLERGEDLAAMWRAIDALSTDLKMALLLRDVVGLSYPEIAAALEIPLSTVKWRIFHARERVVLAVARRDLALLRARAL
ncbi:MAG TPA: sigma-70 family RNA polymerase sigma factor [Gaiellaceae bacterium]|nr:sigma-70 family RNA polymerase sigma factor [Gaiellaceae bacterium]